MDDDDQFKEVLGPLFDELSKLDVEGLTIRDILASREFKRVENTTFVLQMPVSGKTALELASAVEHWAGEECEECVSYLMTFTANLVVSLWDTIMLSLEIGDE